MTFQLKSWAAWRYRIKFPNEPARQTILQRIENDRLARLSWSLLRQTELYLRSIEHVSSQKGFNVYQICYSLLQFWLRISITVFEMKRDASAQDQWHWIKETNSKLCWTNRRQTCVLSTSLNPFRRHNLNRCIWFNVLLNL
jgi:hypothetical protein